MTNSIVKAKLLAKNTDIYNYVTYAFQNIDNDEYILCTRCPNWDHAIINVGETGILHFTEVIAGRDTWFDGSTDIPYNYSNWYFIKFIPLKENVDNKIILD